MSAAQLQALIDRNDIIDTMSRYASGIDRRDAALYRSCFTDDLEVDVSGNGFEQMTADAWVARALQLVGTFQTTQHIITNHTLAITGDEASCAAYLQAQHWNPENFLLVGGHYDDKLVRTPDGWRICRLQLTITWTKTG
jgi:hypothetical protein